VARQVVITSLIGVYDIKQKETFVYFVGYV